jgi:tetrahydromethanopterin S-methyltransferase subunit G
MSQDLKDINSKLDKIVSDIGDIKVTNAVQTEQLKEHMKRSDMLEQRVEQVDSELRPIKEHIIVLRGIMKIVGGVAVVATIARAFQAFL